MVSKTRTSNPASRRRSPDRADSKVVRADKVASKVAASRTVNSKRTSPKLAPLQSGVFYETRLERNS